MAYAPMVRRGVVHGVWTKSIDYPGSPTMSGPDAFINMAAIILRNETALQLVLEIENQCPVTQL